MGLSLCSWGTHGQYSPPLIATTPTATHSTPAVADDFVSVQPPQDSATRVSTTLTLSCPGPPSLMPLTQLAHDVEALETNSVLQQTRFQSPRAHRVAHRGLTFAGQLAGRGRVYACTVMYAQYVLE